MVRLAVDADWVFVAVGRGAAAGLRGLAEATWPRDIGERLRRAPELARDPIAEAAQSDAEFVEPAALEALAAADATFRPALDLFADLGLATPALVPARDPLGAQGCVGFGRAEGFAAATHAQMRLLALPLHRTIRWADRAGFAHRAGLTKRELECLAWVAEGKTAPELAVILGVSQRTIVAHVSGATAKLGATSRFHAAVIALRAGLID